MNDPTNDIIDNIFLTNVGKQVVFIIRRRTTEKGEFLPGSSPDAGQYSTKTFAMPLFALNKMMESRVINAAANNKSKYFDKDNFNLWMSNKGNIWVSVIGGYRKLRELVGRPVEHVMMSFSNKSKYISSIDSKNIESGFEVDWNNPDAQKLSEYHEILGAGKSHRLHKIMGLTPEELDGNFKSFVDSELLKKFKQLGF